LLRILAHSTRISTLFASNSSTFHARFNSVCFENPNRVHRQKEWHFTSCRSFECPFCEQNQNLLSHFVLVHIYDFNTMLRVFATSARAVAVKVLSTMDAQTRADIAQYTRQLTSGRVPKPPLPMRPSETSLTWQIPPHQQGAVEPDYKPSDTSSQRHIGSNDSTTAVYLAKLIRDDGQPASLREWASLCVVERVNRTALARFAGGMANGEIPLLAGACNWTVPMITSIPDSRALTASGILHSRRDGSLAGLRYLIGNQLPAVFDRDPLSVHFFFCCAKSGAEGGRFSSEFDDGCFSHDE
jgi:hypothetical protein